MTTGAPVEPTAGRACFFRLGGQLFAADVGRVREVLVLEESTAVPLGPPHLIGLTNVRGHVMPVLDARALLGLPPERIGRGTPVLVLGPEPQEVGIAIDAAVGLGAVETARPPGEAIRTRFGPVAAGVVEWGGEPVTLLDVDALLERLGVAGDAGGRD